MTETTRLWKPLSPAIHEGGRRPCAASELEPQVGSVLGERYRLLACLGRGGMGTVFLAQELALGRRVALKVLAPKLARVPSERERFRREAELGAHLGHPNVPAVWDYHASDSGPCYLVMELVRGRTLAELLELGVRLSSPRLRWIARQLLETLASLHSRGVLHRDLKPSNLMLTWAAGQNDVLRVLDLGIASACDGQDETLLGTPAYMAPERAHTRCVDQRAELYSAAVVLFQLATGRLPTYGGTPESGAEEAAVPTIEQLRPGFDAGLSSVCARAMQRDPAQRFASAEAMLEALEECPPASEEKPRARRPLREPPRSEKLRFGITLTVAAALLVAVAGVVSVFEGSASAAARLDAAPPAAGCRDRAP